MLSGNPEMRARRASVSSQFGREHGISAFLMYGSLLLSCARLRADSTASSLTEMREALSALTDSGARSALPMLLGSIADIEAEAENFEGALARVDEALSLAHRPASDWMRLLPPSHPRRDFAQARSHQSVAGRGGLSHRRCYRAAAEGKELRAASGTVPGEALSVDRPSRRCPGGPRRQRSRALGRRRSFLRSNRRRGSSTRHVAAAEFMERADEGAYRRSRIWRTGGGRPSHPERGSARGGHHDLRGGRAAGRVLSRRQRYPICWTQKQTSP